MHARSGRHSARIVLPSAHPGAAITDASDHHDLALGFSLGPGTASQGR
jgi:hypothetical protein